MSDGVRVLINQLRAWHDGIVAELHDGWQGSADYYAARMSGASLAGAAADALEQFVEDAAEGLAIRAEQRQHIDELEARVDELERDLLAEHGSEVLARYIRKNRRQAELLAGQPARCLRCYVTDHPAEFCHTWEYVENEHKGQVCARCVHCRLWGWEIASATCGALVDTAGHERRSVASGGNTESAQMTAPLYGRIADGPLYFWSGSEWHPAGNTESESQ